MRSNNTFGLHFVLRPAQKGNHAIYIRIVVNRTRCELALKQTLDKKDWNTDKGAARPKTPALKQLNTYLEEVRAKLVSHYQQLNLSGDYLTAEMLKNSYLGKTAAGEEKMTLNRLVALHNEMMGKTLEPGTMKNYKSTAIYLRNYMNLKYDAGDIYLKDLTYQFITGFEWYIRNNPLKEGDPCTNNGTMKHLERLKKMVTWAYTNEWIDKDPFIAYNLRFKRHEMEFLDKDELAQIEGRALENPMLRRVRDLFIFSCYTGLAYIDLVMLRPANIIAGADGMKWIRTSRKKTEIPVNVPLLRPAVAILEKFRAAEDAGKWVTLFPMVSNQEMNRSLKVIGEICEIKKRLTFHLARHTFATTVTLLNGVPIETISKLLGHTKLATTMIYAHVVQSKIGMDMLLLENKLARIEPPAFSDCLK
jgi:site-specific recombinase XerD